jgi:signal transduction histidine kinase
MSVIGYADLMVDAATEGKALSLAELHEYGRVLQLSGARIFRIVENLLFWARLETPREAPEGPGRAAPVQEEVTPEGLRRLAAMVSRQFGRQQDVAIECTSGARIQVVTLGFEFVTSHILENALKYSLPGTPVRIEARTKERMLLLSVSDSGRGMTQEQLSRIRMFRQFEARSIEHQGLGMGLMLATTFARMSGGYLELQPGDYGRGLTVLMSLPLATGSVPPY